MAYGLGDATPSLNSRDGWHPLVHVDLVGLIFFLSSGVGWAKALPLQHDNFKQAKRDSALVLLAGTLSCFASFLFFMLLSSVLLQFQDQWSGMGTVIWLCLYTAVLSLSFAMAQWLPLPFFAVYQFALVQMPEKIQGFAMKIQGYLVLALLVLLWGGYATPVFSTILGKVIEPFCLWVPFTMIEYYFL